MNYQEVLSLILLGMCITYFLTLLTRPAKFACLFVAGNPNFDAMLSTTIANYRDTFADNLSRSFFLAYWLTTRGRKITEDGGTDIVVQLMYGLN